VPESGGVCAIALCQKISRHPHFNDHQRCPECSGGSIPEIKPAENMRTNRALSRKCFTNTLGAIAALGLLFFPRFTTAEEVENLLWQGAKLVAEVPDNLVRVDNTDSDIAKVLKATKHETYTLLFSFVDSKSLKAASESRIDGDSAPLPYATITVPRDFLIPGRSPSMTPAEMVEAMKIHMAQEKAKGAGASNSAVISQSDHYVTILTRSKEERKVGGISEKKDMAHISSHVNAGKFFVLISVSGPWTNEAEVYKLSLLNDKLREGLKIVLENP
jgi:hypothetical protein